ECRRETFKGSIKLLARRRRPAQHLRSSCDPRSPNDGSGGCRQRPRRHLRGLGDRQKGTAEERKRKGKNRRIAGEGSGSRGRSDVEIRQADTPGRSGGQGGREGPPDRPGQK